MTYRRIVALAAALVSLSACQFRYNWRSLGPFETSGPVRHVIVDPGNSQRLYAAAENGGVWVLDDASSTTASWRPLTDNLDNLQMRGLAKAIADPEYIVAGNALGFVYHSRDNGGSWSRITDQNFQYIRRILMYEGLTRIEVNNYTRLAKQTLIWVASQTGLYRMELINNVHSKTDTLFPIAPQHGPDVLDVVQHPINKEELYIGVRGQGVWRTPDGGRTWSNTATAAAFGEPSSTMIKLAINSSRVVAKMGQNVILRDIPGDTAWRFADSLGFLADDNGGNDIGYRGGYTGSTGDWHHAIAIHPTDPDIIAVGATAFFLTNNGGDSWSSSNTGHEDIQALTFSPTGDRLFIANDGGVFRRQTSNGNFTDLNRGLTTIQFYRAAKNGQAVAGPADHQGIRGTRNIDADPPVWERATNNASGFGINGLENDFVYADTLTPGRFFMTFQSQFLLRMRYPQTGVTQDLLPLDAPATPLQPFSIRSGNNEVNNMLNYAHGQVAFDPRAGSNTIVVSAHENLNTSFSIRLTRQGNRNPTGGPANGCGDDNSRTWCFTTPVANNATWLLSFGPVGTPIMSIAFSRTEARRVYALNEAGSVLMKDDIDDDTTPWRMVGNIAVDPGDFARQILPSRTTSGRVYALAHRKLMLSVDSGSTWQRIGETTLPAVQLNSITEHPSKPGLLYLSTASDVLVSRNSGSSWESIGATLPNAPVMQLFGDDGYLYAATFGRGLWRAKLPN